MLHNPNSKADSVGSLLNACGVNGMLIVRGQLIEWPWLLQHKRVSFGGGGA